MWRRAILAVALALVLLEAPAGAQSLVTIPSDPAGQRGAGLLCLNVAGTAWQPCSAANPLATTMVGGSADVNVAEVGGVAVVGSLPVTAPTPLDINVSEWGGAATTLGQKTMAGSVPVALASDQGSLAVSASGSISLSNAPPGASSISGSSFFSTGPTDAVVFRGGPIWLNDYTAFAVRENNSVYLSTDRGRTWAAYGTVGALTAAKSVAAYGNVILIAGRDGAADDKQVWLSGNSGVTWTQITLAGGFNASVACAIGLKSTGTAIVLTEKGTYRSTNYGVVWARVDATDMCTDSSASGKVISPDTNIWLAVGNNGGVPGIIRRSIDDGVTWSTVFAGDAAATVTGDLACSTSTMCFMVRGATANKEVWRSTDAGATWALSFYMGGATNGPVGVVAITSSVIAAFGDYTLGVYRVWRTLDSGITWSDAGAMPAVTACGAPNCMVRGSVNSFGDVILQSNAGGASGQAYYSPTLDSHQFVLVGTNALPLGTSTNPVRIDPTGTTTQPVSGTVTAGQGAAAAGTSAWPVASIQGASLFNSSTTGAANTAVTATIAAAASTRPHLYAASAFCSAGSAALTVADGVTTIFTTPAASVGATLFAVGWAVGLTGTTNTAMAVTLGTCGVGNTGTLNVQADRF